jgi:hypothetical protein
MDGNLDVGIQNTHRNFISAMAFPTMGSMMRNVSATPSGFPPFDSKKQGLSLYEYLMKNNLGIKRMSYFSDFYKVLINDLSNFVPSSYLVNTGQFDSLEITMLFFSREE